MLRDDPNIRRFLASVMTGKSQRLLAAPAMIVNGTGGE
jgi:hypothetical protein